MNREKFLSIDPTRCTGCMECEGACSIKHAGKRRSGRPRIQVLGGGTEARNFHFPVTCQQCADPPCMAACPRNAIRREPELGSVVLDDNLCVGCKMCVSACPTGAMGFDSDLGLAYKCDLCSGDPQCAHVCEPKAIEYAPVERIHDLRMIQSAFKFYQVIRNQVSLPAM
jgi:anaerobic carbon-monoxide dehydrogenase iron sulfur subunit